jgi:pimeloyl-ACP methyl ester carboxylesterase
MLIKAAGLGIALSFVVLASPLMSAPAALMAAPAALMSAPAALAADQRADSAMPARMDALQIPSGDAAMNAIVYTPGGPGRHPALVLFHGFPGNEQNLDLAQAARRAGFVVLTLHYRGSWGSPGSFSFANVSADGLNAVDWLMAPEQLASYHIDPRQVSVAGHSMGGFVAMRTAAARLQVKSLLLIDAWNPGEGPLAALRSSGGRGKWTAGYAANVRPLATTVEALADELLAAGASFDLANNAVAMETRPILIIAAEKANAVSNRRIAEALASAGNTRTRLIVMPTDHGFNDHRIALISASLDWLQQFETKP